MRSSILIFETGLRTSPPLVTASELSPEIVSGGVDSSVTHRVAGGDGDGGDGGSDMASMGASQYKAMVGNG